ncbi:MAG: transcriptional regulator [Pseudonocardiales bacterium]|nr:MAG: transcriptional regulator [Pseudonocardiales bacterium]
MQVILVCFPSVKRSERNSHCPVNVALETVGDPWSLLVIRDVVFHGKRTFGEFLTSEERITTSVLTDRLTTLVQKAILTKHRSSADRRRECYSLTEKGLALVPVLVELANWGVSYGPKVIANPVWVRKAETDRLGLYHLICETVRAGGAVFHGQNSVIEKLQSETSRLS